MTQKAVLAAVDRLVDAFFRHDTEAYFAAFAPEATFIFHNVPKRLQSRDDYRALWRQWESQDGFRVRGGNSSNRAVCVHGRTAIFSHDVVTELSFGDVPVTNRERETIIFRNDARSGEWLAIHEHLSVDPSEAVSAQGII